MSIQEPENTLWIELDTAAKGYGEAKESFDAARIRFEVAKRRLEATKEVASEVMPQEEWKRWLADHSSVKYAGMAIGEAAADFVVESTCAFFDEADSKTIGHEPFFRLEDIRQGLIRGGFEFRTLGPNRELHAALIRQAGVEKRGDQYLASERDRFRSAELGMRASDE